MKLKHIFKNLLSGVLVRIKAGPLAGKKWILTTGRKFITGQFEPYKTEAFLNNFRRGDVFFDIGAHFGYFSAIAAGINSGSGQIFAFEPRPMNIKFFKRHISANNFKNVKLFEAAVGETVSEVKFETSHGSATGRVSEKGDLVVKQLCIDKMVKEGILPCPTFIKIDVEGGEIEVLKGTKNVISSCRPRMIIATHGPEYHEYVVNFLNQNNYSIKILNPDSLKGDTEIIAVPD
jgi:FkbM family methyltransferase